jgi:predicted RND superfamily exporter protein
LALYAGQLVSVNYDVIEYLPEDSASTVSLKVMETEFGNGIPNTRVMVKNVTIPQALEYKEKLFQNRWGYRGDVA